MKNNNHGASRKNELASKDRIIEKYELGILAVRPAGATIGDKAMIWKDMKHCVPQTVELRSMLLEQSHWQAAKRKRGS